MSRLTLYQQAADPATPSAGAIHLYAKTDDRLYWKEDDGDVHKVAHSGEAESFLALNATTVTASSSVILASTQKLYLDGGGDTYIVESSANVLDEYAGGVNILKRTPTAVTITGVLFSNLATASQELVDLRHSHASLPAGIQMWYTGADPNGTGNLFLQCYAGGGPTSRTQIRSNGGLANFSANNVNLSDTDAKLLYPIPSFIDEWSKIRWSKYFLKDQTHTDFNFGYDAQNIYDVFKDKAPELITFFDDTNANDNRLGVHETDLHNIGFAVLTELINQFNDLKQQLRTAGIAVN